MLFLVHLFHQDLIRHQSPMGLNVVHSRRCRRHRHFRSVKCQKQGGIIIHNIGKLCIKRDMSFITRDDHI